MIEHIIALDPAKRRDYTAAMIMSFSPEFVSGVESLDQPDRTVVWHDITLLEKVQGITYREVADIGERLMTMSNTNNNAKLLVDGTGVGEAVIEHLIERRIDPLPIIFTGGGSVREVYQETGQIFAQAGSAFRGVRTLKELHVPKVDLVAAGKSLAQSRRIRIVEGIPYRDDFRSQVKGFYGKINEESRRWTFEAITENVHDDLLVCLLMCAWYARRINTIKETTVERNREEATSEGFDPYDYV